MQSGVKELFRNLGFPQALQLDILDQPARFESFGSLLEWPQGNNDKPRGES